MYQAMKALFFLLAIFPFIFQSHAYAERCDYAVVPGSTKIGWTAYKTPEKVGVGGAFTQFNIAGPDKAKDIQTLLERSVFSINATSVKTGDISRDRKISRFFFEKMLRGANIKGFIESIDDAKQTLQLRLGFNNTSGVTQMTYTIDAQEGVFQAKGFIDVLDFNMQGPLKRLNQACHALHKGKTWSDVEIQISSRFKRQC